MGDFEDVFGAGADIESIIDRYSRQHAEENTQPPPYRHWFPTHEEAEAWVQEHPEVTFTRRPKLGGYEICTDDMRRHSWVEHDQYLEAIECVPFFGPAIKRDPSDSTNFRMATQTNTVLELFLKDICDALPFGRDFVFPIRLSLKEMDYFLHRAGCFLSWDLDMPGGAILIAGLDHYALIGRRMKDGYLLEPWLFNFDCGAGPIDAKSESKCFLCIFGPDAHRKGHNPDYDTLYEHDNDDYQLYNTIPEDGYRPGARDTLAYIVLNWCETLSEVDARLGRFVRPPALVHAHYDPYQSDLLDFDVQCKIIAAVYAARGSFESTVRVSASLLRDVLPQMSRDYGYYLSADVSYSRPDAQKSQSVPSPEEYDAKFPFGLWAPDVSFVRRSYHHSSRVHSVGAMFNYEAATEQDRKAARTLWHHFRLLDLSKPVEELISSAIKVRLGQITDELPF
jgi:hypothetical protein